MADRRAELPRATPLELRPRLAAVAAAPAEDAEAGRVVRFSSQDGLLLAARIYDAPPSSRLPLLCLPGLSRNSRDFSRLGAHFSRHPSEPRKVVALDYRGRGLSDADRDWRNYTPLIEAQDVLTAAAALGVENAILVGTSRGGIITMLIGALRPAMIAGVVLNDVGPVVEGTGLARIKKYLSTHRAVATWNEAVAAVRENSGGHFPALTDEDFRASAQAYFAPSAGGRLAPQFDPNLTKIVQQIDLSDKIPVLWPQFESLKRVPVLAVRGEFSDLLSPRTLAAVAARHPRLEQLTIRGQGHPPLLRDEIALDAIGALARRCEE